MLTTLPYLDYYYFFFFLHFQKLQLYKEFAHLKKAFRHGSRSWLVNLHPQRFLVGNFVAIDCADVSDECAELCL